MDAKKRVSNILSSLLPEAWTGSKKKQDKGSKVSNPDFWVDKNAQKLTVRSVQYFMVIKNCYNDSN